MQGKEIQAWADASVDTVIKAVMGFLLLLFPTLYGWAAVDLGGDTTLSQSVAVTVFEFGAGILAVLLGLRLWIHRPWTRDEYGFLKAWPLYAVAGLFLLWCLLQFVPLPPTLHAFLSPRGSHLLDTYQGFVPEGARPMTLLPGQSFVAFLKMAAYVAVFLAAASIPADRRDIRSFLAAATVMGGLTAFLGLLKAFAPDVFTFIFPSGGKGGRASGPFINPNHFAGYLEMCFPLALGLFWLSGPWPRLQSLSSGALAEFIRRQGWKKALAGLACLLMAGGIIASLSRLGIFAFLFSIFVFFYVLLRGRSRKVVLGLVVLAAFAGVFVTSVYVGLDPVLERYSLLEDAGVNRLDAWRMGFDITRDFPLSGSGLGTFRFVSPLYQPATLRGGFHQTHNDYLNLSADLGVFGLILGLLFLFGWFRSVFKTSEHPGIFRPAAAAAFAASVSAMAVHSIGDFNLQVASNGMLFAMVTGMGLALYRIAEYEGLVGGKK
jgi:O-antigen ligase